MSSNEPVKIYEMFYILNCAFEFALIAFITVMIIAYLISNPQFNI